MLCLSLPEPSGAFNPKSTTKQGRAAIVAALGRVNMRAEITPKLIEELQPPTDRAEAFIWDTAVRGWGIRLLRSGTMSWITQMRVRGRSTSPRRAYARVDRLPFTLARERAKTIAALAELGRCWYEEDAARIAAEQAAEQPALDRSLGAMLDLYLADPAVRRRRTYRTIERYLTKTWSPLRPHDAEALAEKQVIERYNEIASVSGPVMANRAVSTLGTAFKWVIANYHVDRSDNPARGQRLTLKEEPSRRNRVPTMEEIGRIWRACDSCWPETFGALVRLLILCGSRRSELALLRRDEIDLDRARIVLPPARIKTGEKVKEPHMIPLSKPALQIIHGLLERRQVRLFPELSWSRCKIELDKVSGVYAWTIHDLRRAYSTHVRDELRAPGEIVELALGHKPGGIEGKYNFAMREAERRAFAEQWACLVLGAAGEPVEPAPSLRVVGGRGTAA